MRRPLSRSLRQAMSPASQVNVAQTLPLILIKPVCAGLHTCTCTCYCISCLPTHHLQCRYIGLGMKKMQCQWMKVVHVLCECTGTKYVCSLIIIAGFRLHRSIYMNTIYHSNGVIEWVHVHYCQIQPTLTYLYLSKRKKEYLKKNSIIER